MPKKSEIQSSILNDPVPVEVRVIFYEVIKVLRANNVKWSGKVWHSWVGPVNRRTTYRNARLQINCGGNSLNVNYRFGEQFICVSDTKIRVANPNSIQQVFDGIIAKLDLDISWVNAKLHGLKNIREALRVGTPVFES